MRLRFAPSPTGYMHIANFRTAIYNWIVAKQNKGKFLIRIEDTDVQRSKEHYEQAIFDIFDKFGLDIDNRNDYIRQSERFECYKKFAKILYDTGYAFYCCCQNTANECVCEDHKHTSGVLRFKVPKNIPLSFNDMIGGECCRNTNDIESFSILRSDGTATYNFAVVVDDHEMMITHVIRGEDHRTNTFKQLLIYNALQWNVPEFAHLPLILGEDGNKLSKRNQDASVESLLEKGYVKEAIFNMIIRIGWGYKDEEIIPRERALEVFNIHNVSRNAAVFDTKKLKALSAHYLRTGDYVNEIAAVFGPGSVQIIRDIYQDLTTRCHTINECQDMCRFIFEDTLYEPENREILKDIAQLDNTLEFDNWFQSIKAKPNGKQIRKTIREIITNCATGLPMSVIYQYRIKNKKIVL